MREGFSTQYQVPCVILDEGDVNPQQVIEYAESIGAQYEDEPESFVFVIQFPGRPIELYTIQALTSSLQHRAQNAIYQQYSLQRPLLNKFDQLVKALTTPNVSIPGAKLMEIFEEIRVLIVSQGDIREELLWFAMNMELTLRDNDMEKGNSWKLMTDIQLLRRIRDELDELDNAVLSTDAEVKAIKEAFDVSNFCFFLAHNLKERVLKKTRRSQDEAVQNLHSSKLPKKD